MSFSVNNTTTPVDDTTTTSSGVRARPTNLSTTNPPTPTTSGVGTKPTKPYIASADVFTQKHVLVRVDYNVPLRKHLFNKCEIVNDAKILASLETIKFLLKRNAKITLISDLGSPKPHEENPDLTLQPIGEYLKRLLPDTTFEFLRECIGNDVEMKIQQQPPKSVYLLENLRFHPGEMSNDKGFAEQLAKPFDIYVNDAFSVCHRELASTCAITEFFDAKFIGFNMRKELDFLSSVVECPKGPVAAVIGGLKASSKMGLLRFLAHRVDKLLIGGAMVFTFYKAMGYEVGGSYVDYKVIEEAREVIDICKSRNILVLAVDAVTIPTEIKKRSYVDATHGKIIVDCHAFPIGQEAMDIGIHTINMFKSELNSCNTIFFNGPMGYYEDPTFAHGTFELLRYMDRRTSHGATTIIAGGDTIAAAHECGSTHLSHISLGGGASLMMLSGRSLPGVEALPDAPLEAL